jgi:predicted Zn-dependent protease
VTLQRAVVLVIAVLAVAWLAVSYGNAREIRHAQVVAADRNATPAEIASAIDELRHVGTLDPGTGAEALSYEASFEIRLNRLDQARRTLDEIVRREPDSAEAWFLIAALNRESDPARSAAAQAQLRRLDPLGAHQP